MINFFSAKIGQFYQNYWWNKTKTKKIPSISREPWPRRKTHCVCYISIDQCSKQLKQMLQSYTRWRNGRRLVQSGISRKLRQITQKKNPSNSSNKKSLTHYCGRIAFSRGIKLTNDLFLNTLLCFKLHFYAYLGLKISTKDFQYLKLHFT